MVKRILLVTLYDEGNIGNRLQNYALQTKLLSYGTIVTTLDNCYTTDFSSSFKLKMLIKRVLAGVVQIPLHRITDSASNGSVFPVVTEHFSASSDHAFL